MKILFLSDNFPPQGTCGGAGFSSFYLARGLKDAGHDVFIITTCQEKSGEKNFIHEGLKIFRIYAKYNLRWHAYIALYNPQTVGKIRDIIKKIDPDIIHSQDIQKHLSYYCLKIAKEFNKPLFLTARDVMLFSFGKLATRKYLERFDARTNWLDHLGQVQKRYNPWRNFFIKRYLKNVDQIFSVSFALKNALGQNGINNVEVSHTGLDVNDWQISPEKVMNFKRKYGLLDKKIVLLAGRVSGLKGCEQARRAMEKVQEEVPRAFLLVVGDSGSVGWLQGEDLKAAYHSSEIVIMPSICLDAFPRSNLEAMACKKPVVATCFGGSAEVVEDGKTGYIVNPLNVDLFAEKILDLLKNPGKAKAFGEAGFQRIQDDFNLTGHVNQTLDYYQKALFLRQQKKHD
ncbi:MAG: glycosyltransferase family 4 protein [Candidatus Nealsonbacteria bacterium]|nr:glycosyltransferase family 4 protein [Candidatus Nealsonbacteria bacterium]